MLKEFFLEIVSKKLGLILENKVFSKIEVIKNVLMIVKINQKDSDDS